MSPDRRKTSGTRRPPILVVGAGAQGLTFALALALRGEPVVLVEASSRVGGQARSFRYDGFVFDLGLHAFVSRDPEVLGLVRRVLGPELTRFRPRAASLLANGALVEDSSSWCVGSLRRSLYSLIGGEDDSWNCMRISAPPRIIYPRRGGFGSLFERMAALLARRGGVLRLGTAVDPRSFEIRGSRLVSATVGGKTLQVAGCYWAAGDPRRSAAQARGPGGRPETLVLFHFLARGRAPVPYHWARLYDAQQLLLPRLVYYPKRFSRANAPAGAHSVAAAVPVPAAERLPASARGLADWFVSDPAAFAPLVRRHLAAAGLLRERDVLRLHVERETVAPAGAARSDGPFSGLSNVWDARRWLEDDARESGVPLQMKAALNAAREILRGAARFGEGSACAR